jgi:LysM repeat protein
MGNTMRPACRLLSALLIALSPLPQSLAAQPTFAQGRYVEREVVRYTVRAGDTMSSIARGAGIPLGELRSLNPDVDPRYLRVGQTIYLPAEARVSRLSLSLDSYRGRLDDEVVLRASGFAPGTRVQIVAGEGPYRLEVIDVARVDRRGRVDVAVDLPEWARPGQQIYFGVQSRDGRERAVADAYQIAGRQGRGERGQVSISGTLTRQGVECPTMRGDDGRTYSLAGDIRGFRPGDRVVVEGRIAEMSFCQQGTAIDVRRMLPAN